MKQTDAILEKEAAELVAYFSEKEKWTVPSDDVTTLLGRLAVHVKNEDFVRWPLTNRSECVYALALLCFRDSRELIELMIPHRADIEVVFLKEASKDDTNDAFKVFISRLEALAAVGYLQRIYSHGRAVEVLETLQGTKA